MSELKLSITILVSYIILILGLANIDAFQESVLDFSPLFFVFIGVIVFSQLMVTGSIINRGFNVSYYMVVLFWSVVYIVVAFYLADRGKSMQVQIIQFLLVAISAGLAYDVGKRINQVDETLNGLSSSAFPNRVRELALSQDLISAEIKRSRRYHRPLPILVLKLEKRGQQDNLKQYEALEQDVLERFAIAKASQILSDLARTTDIILRDKNGQFVVICPETNFNNLIVLAERLEAAVANDLDARLKWASALFPDEALTFDELVETARSRLEISHHPDNSEEKGKRTG
jgi:GGDEF domain-containing protein